jgi:hypothetical protein
MEPADHYQAFLDKIVSIFTSDAYRDHLLRAKAEYFRLTGEVHEDDPFFEPRMASFIDWYLFDRPIEGDVRPPVERYIVDRRLVFRPDERLVFEGFLENVHSLFELRGRKPGAVVLLDLLANEKRRVVERREWSAIEKGDVFEGRLIPYQGEYFFTRGFCFFPLQARKYILREAKHARKAGGDAPAELMQRLAYLRYLQERFRHVDVRRIYSEDGLSILKNATR